MREIFTIGFTKKTAEEFFYMLKSHGVRKVIDVRLFNSSQLLAFSKYPDIKYFLNTIAGIDYFQDMYFTPTERLLESYKKKLIDWRDYEKAFAALMASRDIDDYILNNYADAEGLCLLCSEQSPLYCHRRLVAERIATVLGDVKIVHL